MFKNETPNEMLTKYIRLSEILINFTLSGIRHSGTCGCNFDGSLIAFDCLPHDLMIAKLRASGLLVGAVKLHERYFKDRSQQVRLGPCTST